MAFVLFTGGKDSTYALHVAHASGYEITGLCCVVPASRDSILFHYTEPRLFQLLGRAYSMRVCLVEGVRDDLPSLKEALRECARELGGEYVVAGALRSSYQLMKFSQAALAIGLKIKAPLWLRGGGGYLRELIECGVRFIITKISTAGMPARLLGTPVDLKTAEEIESLSERWGFDPSFEGGEAETLVLSAPLMRAKLNVRGYAVAWGERGEFIIEEAWLEEKKAGKGAQV
ncbi:MAG: diphthine--ammonia ligase [Fervidicoccaceae archaeon]